MLALFPKVPKMYRPKRLKIDVFEYSTFVWRPSPENSRINLIIAVFIQIFIMGSETHAIWNKLRSGRSRSSKVVDLGTNRMELPISHQQ